MSMTPINRKRQRRGYLLAGAGVFLAFFFLTCHIGKVGFEDATSILAGLEHMTEHPLDIFPINWEVVQGLAPLGLLPSLLIYAEYLRKRDLRPSVESGSAQWNENIKGYNKQYAQLRVVVPKPLMAINKVLFRIPLVGKLYQAIWKKLEKNFGVLDRSPETRNMIMSNDIYLCMDGRMTRRNCNVLIIGGSGTGKSRFCVKPNMLQANCSYVITDPSGELLETMGTYLKNIGYEVRVFNLVQMEHSNCYNPFHYIRNEQGVLTMINALIQNTTPKGANKGDPFWEKAETALLQACCFYLQSECNPEDRNFSNVMKLLRCCSAVEGREDEDSTLDIMMNDLKEKNPEHIAVLSYAVFKSAGGGKTAQSILISCQTRLQTFNLTAIKNLTNTDNIDLGSLGDRKTALFCTTSVNDSAFNFLVSLMYTQLFETLYYHAETECKGMRLPVHVRFLLDEFANIGTIPEFSQKLATMRKYEISCTIIIQALSQLKAMYKDDWEVLVGNCDSCIFLGGSDATTLEYISKKLGKQTIRSINNNRSYGRQGSYSMSYNKTGRELMTTDELAVMNNDNCIVFIRGLYPFFTRKFVLESHPNYKKTGDADKSLNFDVKKVLHTGQNLKDLHEENKGVRLCKDAQISDTREAEREHRRNTRPVVQKTDKGDPCFQIEPINEIIPHYGVPADQLNQEQLEQRRIAEENLEMEDVYVPSEAESLARYAEEVHLEMTREFYSTGDEQGEELQNDLSVFENM